jgi:hypothetical protein
MKALPARLPRSTVIDRPIYTISVEQWTLEEFQAGRCPEGVSREAHRLLKWQREAERARTRTTPTTTTKKISKKKKKFTPRA